MEAFTLEGEEICDWCGTAQVVKQSFDLRRMLCVDQTSCLSRMPPSAKNHSMGGKDIITFPCVIPHCEGKSIRQGGFCTKHTHYTSKDLRAAHAPHGTVNRYKHGCKCIECKRGNARYKLLAESLKNYTDNPYEIEGILQQDLEGWMHHILDVYYHGEPDKKVTKVLGENHKIKYAIIRIADEESVGFYDELIERIELRDDIGGPADGQGEPSADKS